MIICARPGTSGGANAKPSAIAPCPPRSRGLRPANHPQRRLALAAHWLAKDDLPARLEKWCAAEVKESALVKSLLDLLQVREDEFWTRHWTLRSARMRKSQPLVGDTRVTD